MPTAKPLDTGLYTSLAKLLLLRYKAAHIPRTQYSVKHHALTGQLRSAQRGRGLNFEELRHYQIGDDIRQFDWKVTHRTKKPHVRVYTEEKEQAVLLLIDQRNTMFFGSTQNTKAVVAAELGALLAWRAHLAASPVGAVLMGDRPCNPIMPQRGRAHTTELLRVLAGMNQRLQAGTVEDQTGQFNQALNALLQTTAHDKEIWLISDMNGFDANAEQYVSHLAHKNKLHIALVYDKLERALPASKQLPISDGVTPLSIDTRSVSFRNSYQQSFEQRLAHINKFCKKQGVSVALFNTDDAIETQLSIALNTRGTA